MVHDLLKIYILVTLRETLYLALTPATLSQHLDVRQGDARDDIDVGPIRRESAHPLCQRMVTPCPHILFG